MGPSGPQKSPEATASTHETNVPKKVLMLKRCWIEVPFKYPMISGKPSGEPAGQKNCKREKKPKTESTIIMLMCYRHLWTLFLSPALTLLCSWTNFSRINRWHRYAYNFWLRTKIQAPNSVAVSVLGEENDWREPCPSALPSHPMPEAGQPLVFAQAGCGAGCTCEPAWFVQAVHFG